MEFLAKAPRTPPPAPQQRASARFMSHFHKVGGKPPDNLSGFLVNTAVPAQITGVMVGDLLIRFNAQIKIFQKLAHVNDIDPLFLEYAILDFVIILRFIFTIDVAVFL